MTNQGVMDKLIMDCFTHGMVRYSSEVTFLLGDKYKHNVIVNALTRLSSEGRISRKQPTPKGAYAYWLDLSNIEPKPAVFCEPIISEPVYKSKLHKAASAVINSFWAVIIVFVPWIVMFGMMVN